MAFTVFLDRCGFKDTRKRGNLDFLYEKEKKNVNRVKIT